MAIGGNFGKPGMGSGAAAPLPSGGIQGTATNYVQPGSQFSQQNIQRSAQQQVPFQGMYNGNPRGASNMPRMGNQNPFGFQGQGQAPAWSQQTNLGRYVPPTMSSFGGNAGGFNSNSWNNQGGYDYNLPGSYGSPLGQGQFAPMPQQFMQYLQQMGGFGGGMGGGMGDYEREAFISGGMPPGKDGRPLREGPQFGVAPMFNRRRFGRGAEAPQQAPTPAYDQPDNRAYNMAALQQMMGGY